MTSYRIVLCIGFLMAGLIGCKKEGSATSAGGGDSTTTGANSSGGAASSEDDVTGQWQAVKAEMSGKPLPAGLDKDFLSMKQELRADHTYNAFNNMAGRMHGTWALSGTTVTLTPKTTNPLLKSSTLNVEKPNLVSRDDSIVVIYEKKGPATVDSGPKFALTAAEFLAEVKKDVAGSKTKYDGAKIELSGYVSSIDPGATGVHVFIDGPPAAGRKVSDLFLGLVCVPEEPEVWGKIARFQKVKVVGVAIIAYGAASLDEAVFTLDGPSILKSTTVEELAAEFAKDPKALEAKYEIDGTPGELIVTGTLLEKQINSGKESTLTLGKGDARITCDYANGGNDVPKDLDPLKVGDPIKLAGYYATTSSDKTPRLHGCLLIKK